MVLKPQPLPLSFLDVEKRPPPPKMPPCARPSPVPFIVACSPSPYRHQPSTPRPTEPHEAPAPQLANTTSSRMFCSHQRLAAGCWMPPEVRGQGPTGPQCAACEPRRLDGSGLARGRSSRCHHRECHHQAPTWSTPRGRGANENSLPGWNTYHPQQSQRHLSGGRHRHNNCGWDQTVEIISWRRPNTSYRSARRRDRHLPRSPNGAGDVPSLSSPFPGAFWRARLAIIGDRGPDTGNPPLLVQLILERAQHTDILRDFSLSNLWNKK